MIYTIWCLYITTVIVSFSVSLAIGLYEEWVVRGQGRSHLHTWDEWKENLLNITIVALIPIMNMFSTMFAIGYFCVEHLPYIINNIRGKNK